MLKLDTTAPVASMVVTGGHLGLNGWYVVAPIIATAFGTDSVSGPVECDPMLQSLATETLSTTLTATCENQAGLTSNASVTVKIDLTAPVTTIAASAAPDGDNGWYVTNPTLVTTGVEDMSNPIVCTGLQVISTETTGIDVLGTCTNSAGLSSSDTETIKLDKTPPTLVVTMPAAVQLNAVVSAVPTATDATSGVASATCDPVATNVLGTFEVTCTAEDNAGNITAVTVEYQVLSTAVGSGDCGKILFGTLPPAGGGYGTFAFSCGSLEQLLTASGCPQSTAVFFYNLPGRFVVYIPGTTVSAANTEFLSIFNGDPRIPVNTIFTAKCR